MRPTGRTKNGSTYFNGPNGTGVFTVAMQQGTDEERGRVGNDGIKGATVNRKPRRNFGWVTGTMLLAVYRAAKKQGKGIEWVTERLNAIKESRKLPGDLLMAPTVDDDGKAIGGSVNGLTQSYRKLYGENSLPKLSRGRAKHAPLSMELLEAGVAEFDEFFATDEVDADEVA